jgi:iron-sulfur cluster assembly protein
MEYAMKLDLPGGQDQVFDQGGVKLIVDPESLGFLDGSRIDYSDSLSDAGFKVENPQAARSCGCGSSFEPRSA